MIYLKCHIKKLMIVTTIIALLMASNVIAIQSAISKNASIGQVIKQTDMIKEIPIMWQDNLDTAMAVAEAEYKPIFLLFSSPSCSWCQRLRDEVIPSPEIEKLLQHFILVDIDTSIDITTPARYRISGVPTIIILSPDGTPQNGANGFVTATQLDEILRSSLNPNIIPAKDAQLKKLLASLTTNNIEQCQWDQIALAMGDKNQRKAIKEHVSSLNPQPKKPLVQLLYDKRLAVRLGALELLEEISGKSFDYDPWQGPAKAKTTDINDWQEWAEATNTHNYATYTALTENQIDI